MTAPHADLDLELPHPLNGKPVLVDTGIGAHTPPWLSGEGTPSDHRVRYPHLSFRGTRWFNSFEVAFGPARLHVAIAG